MQRAAPTFDDEPLNLASRDGSRQLRLHACRATGVADAISLLELAVKATSARSFSGDRFSITMRQTFLSDRTSYAFTVLTEADSDGLRLGVYGELTEVEGSIDGERVALDPLSLDGQTCDASGTVVMPGGSIVRGITFARRLSPNNDLTDEERKILSLVVAFVDPDNRYGLWRLLVSDTGIQSKLPEALEKATVFDFAHVGALKLPSLKELHWRVREHMPAISASKVQRALERAGIRRPRSGPRSRRGPRSATIACVNDLMRE